MASGFRNGAYNGVRYLVENGMPWFMARDVAMVLDDDEVESSESLRHFAFDGEGGDYIPHDELARIVDSMTADGCRSPRAVWVQLWYDDLSNYVETGEELREFLYDTPLDGDIADAMEAAGAGEAIVSHLRADAACAGVEIGAALDDIGDALSFIHGMRCAVALANAGVRTAELGLSDLYARLCNAEAVLERANRRLEDMAEADDE